MKKDNNFNADGRKEFVYILDGVKATFIGLETTLKRDFPTAQIIKIVEL